MNQVLVQYEGDMAITVTLSPPAAVAVPRTVDEPRPFHPMPKPDRRSRPAEADRLDGDLTYNQFWAEARELFPDLKAPAIRQALGVDTMRSWTAQGKTLRHALDVLKQLSSEEPALPP